MGATLDKMRGSAKEFVGKVTGNRRMRVKGKLLKARGAVRGAGSKLARDYRAERTRRDVRRTLAK